MAGGEKKLTKEEQAAKQRDLKRLDLWKEKREKGDTSYCREVQELFAKAEKEGKPGMQAGLKKHFPEAFFAMEAPPTKAFDPFDEWDALFVSTDNGSDTVDGKTKDNGGLPGNKENGDAIVDKEANGTGSEIGNGKVTNPSSDIANGDDRNADTAASAAAAGGQDKGDGGK